MRVVHQVVPGRVIELRDFAVYDVPGLAAPAESAQVSGAHRPVGTSLLFIVLMTTFDTLGLSADLLRTVAEEGYTEPTPVQRPRAVGMTVAFRVPAGGTEPPQGVCK